MAVGLMLKGARVLALKNTEKSIKMAFKSGRIEKLPDGQYRYLNTDGKTEDMDADGMAAHIWLKLDAEVSRTAGSAALNLGVLEITKDDIKKVLLATK